MIGGMIVVAPPPFAQAENLLSPLSQQPASAAMQSNDPFLDAAHDAAEKQQWNAVVEELQHSGTFLLLGGVKSSDGVVTSPLPAMGYVIQARTAVDQRD